MLLAIVTTDAAAWSCHAGRSCYYCALMAMYVHLQALVPVYKEHNFEGLRRQILAKFPANV